MRQILLFVFFQICLTFTQGVVFGIELNASPLIGTVEKIDVNKMEIHYSCIVFAPRYHFETFTINGVRYSKTTVQYGRVKYLAAFTPENNTYSAKGVLLKIDDFWNSIKIGSKVLISSDGKMISPSYLELIEKEIVILVPPIPEDGSITVPEED